MTIIYFLAVFILVPILVHLYDFRRTKKVLFSNLRFLDSLKSKSRRVSKLRQYLILFNRILIVICTVVLLILLARAHSDYPNSNDLGVYYDNSYSSSTYLHEGFTENFGEMLSKTNAIVQDNFSYYRYDLGKSVVSSMDRFSMNQKKLSSIVSQSKLTVSSDLALISDFQGVTIEDLSLVLKDSLRDYFLTYLDVDKSLINVYVDSVFVRPSSINPYTAVIEISLSAQGSSSSSIVIKLLSDGKQLGSFVKSSSDVGTVSFDVPSDSYGEFIVEISGDDVIFDNHFRFFIKKQERSAIYIVDESGSNYLTKAFANVSFFDVNISNSANLDFENLSNADVIILNGLEEIPNHFSIQYPNASFIIFPPEKANLSSYADFVSLNQFSRNLNDFGEITFNKAHPLLAGIFEDRRDLDTSLELPIGFAISGNYNQIVDFRDGTPFLLQKSNLYLFNTVLGLDGGFQTSGLFLPILYQIAFESSQHLEPLYSFPKDLRKFDNNQGSEQVLRIVNEDSELVPSYNFFEKQFVIEVPETIDPGFYKVYVGDSLKTTIAVNIPKEESILERVSFEEMSDVFDTVDHVQVYRATDSLNLTSIVDEDGLALWKYALLLILVFTLSEVVLHRLFK